MVETLDGVQNGVYIYIFIYINPSKLTWQAEHVIFGWKRKNILSATHESFEFHVTFQGFCMYGSGSMYTYTHISYIIIICINLYPYDIYG